MKKEVVVWTRLAPLQLQLYSLLLASDAVKSVLNTKRSPLTAITLLKKVAIHPLLVREIADHNIASRFSSMALDIPPSVEDLRAAARAH